MREQIVREQLRNTTEKYVDAGTLMAIVDIWWMEHIDKRGDMPPHIKDIIHDLALDGFVFKSGRWNKPNGWTDTTDWRTHEYRVLMRMSTDDDWALTKKIRMAWDYFKHILGRN